MPMCSNLDTEPLVALLTAMRSLGYKKLDKEPEESIAYDPVTVLFLEFMITLAIRNPGRIELVWPYTVDYIFGVLEYADKQSVLVVERTVVGLLRLCIRFAGKVSPRSLILCRKKLTQKNQENMQEDILKCLRLLRDFPQSVTQAVAEQMMAGIFNLSSANSENLK